jgi:hypothetical protein
MEKPPKHVPYRPWLATFSISTVCASLVWALSPAITSHKEPWDSANHYYPLALLVAGLVSGLVSPRHKLAYYSGAVIGQLLFALIFLESGPLLLVGVAFMAAYSVAFYVAALLANYLRQLVVGNASQES